jgi:hypothetical protein
MKMLFLLLLSLNAFSQSRDCVNCGPEIYPQLPNVPVPTWPLELIEIKKEDLKRNGQVEFCKRPEEMLDTIVLHHSETTSSRTPAIINQYHLDRGWYMSGYSYMVNAAYPGAVTPMTAVTEGRPIDLVGSHAGTEAFVPMTPAQQEMWDAGKIVCRIQGGELRIDPKQVRGNTIKANVTTLGVVVIGNYVQYSRRNPSGYPRGKVRNPTVQTQDAIARLACQLQKKYPNIKEIKWHNVYNATDCPGTIQNFVTQIKTMAKGYGCDF